MASKKAGYRRSISKRNYKRIPIKYLVLFRYGILQDKKFAKGYCQYHKCFISGKDLQEKHCNRKYCKYYNKNIEVFV